MRVLKSIPAMVAAAAVVSGLSLPQALRHRTSRVRTPLSRARAPVKTRHFTPRRRSESEATGADKLREFKTRQITVEENKASNVDIEIFFDFDSAEILPQARPSLDELGKALSDAKLAGGTSPGIPTPRAATLTTSRCRKRRADSVKAFLIQTCHVDGERLSAIGFGEEQPKNKDEPFADENLRVQIVNTGSANVAEGTSVPARSIAEVR